MGQPAAPRFLRETGSHHEFRRRENAYLADEALPLSLTREGTAWALRNTEDVTERYAEDGRLLCLTDRNGVSQNLFYNPEGQVVRIEHSSGRTLGFRYNEAGLIEALIDPEQRETTYSYDELARLRRVTYPDKRYRDYHYEDEDFLFHITGRTDERGVREFTVRYDYQGRAIETVGPAGAERYRIRYGGSSLRITDPLDTVRTYQTQKVLDNWHINASTQACSTCGGSDSATQTYDSRGFVDSETDFRGNLTRYTHNARGLEESRTEASGTPQARTITTQWHPQWRVPVRITEPTAQGNRVTTQTLDEQGNVRTRTVTVASTSRTWAYTYNDFGQVLTEDGTRTDVTDVTTYTYDAQGNLRSVEDPTGLLTRYTDYSAGGLLRAMVDPAGLETRYRYDDRDRLIEVSTGAEGASQREITAYAYDEAGNLGRITLPDASYLAYRYNDEGWMSEIRDTLGNRAEYGYDRLGNRDREELFDGAGQLAQTQRQVSDQLGRLRQQIGANADEITTFGHDPQGNLTSLQSPEHSLATVNRYDALNRLEHRLDALEQAVGYSYDAQDNLRTVTDPRGLVTLNPERDCLASKAEPAPENKRKAA